LEEAEDKRPSCVFFDEVDALFTKAPDNPLNSTFIPFFDRISKEGKKVFFIGATNKVLDVSDNIRVRRLDTAYFPLP
ncbi:MAG: AAA family ATPase, partial [Candidatus Thorarchaeota archaeon]|nr:AAA family ATPase [Candidatus Thorarchaeota archaeon]